MVQRYTRSVTFEEDSLKFYRAPLRVSQNLTDAPVTIWGERNKREGRTSLPTIQESLWSPLAKMVSEQVLLESVRETPFQFVLLRPGWLDQLFKPF